MRNHFSFFRFLQKILVFIRHLAVSNKILLMVLLISLILISCLGLFLDSYRIDSLFTSKTLAEAQVPSSFELNLRSLWNSFSKGLGKGLKESLITVPIFLLTLYIVITVSSALRRAFQKLLQSQYRNQIFRGLWKTLSFITLLVILHLCVSAIAVLFNSSQITLYEFVSNFLYELFISIILVIVFYITWKFVVGNITYGDSLEPFDENIIQKGEVRELEQIQSLKKWIQKGDETGFLELLEEVEYGSGLCKDAQFLVKRELRRSRVIRFVFWKATQDKKYEQRLCELLQ